MERIAHLDRDRLNKLGIRLHARMINSSHIVVTYPEKSVLPKISSEEIFGGFDTCKERFALYVHIPFCTGICHYCGFSRWANPSEIRVAEFLHALEKEADLVKLKLGEKVKVRSIYIGGGTPTILNQMQMRKLFDILHENFEIVPGGEVTMEGSPDTIDKERVTCMMDNGVNRFSMGAESFDNSTLKDIGRRHTAGMTLRAFDTVKEGGFGSINIDLIRGLPGYKAENVYHDLEIISQYGFPSVSSYAATIKPKTIWSRKIAVKPSLLPSEQNRILIHILFVEGMRALGYKQRPVDWFTIDNRYEYRQQSHKWKEMINLIALGPSAYGYINGTQYYNEGHDNLQEYYAPLRNGLLPMRHGLKLDANEQARRNLIFGLKYGIGIRNFMQKHGIDPRKIEPQIYDSLRDNNLIKENNDVIELSYVGQLFADEIMNKFIRLSQG